MGFGVTNFRIALYLKTFIRQSFSKGLGISNNLWLVGILEGIHFKCSHQQSQKGSQVMVTDCSRKRTPLYRFPQLKLRCTLFIGSPNYTSLRTVKSLVRGTRDDVRTFCKWILEMRSDQAQHMCHVVHDNRPGRLCVQHFTNGRNRFRMQNHALTEYDQSRIKAVK